MRRISLFALLAMLPAVFNIAPARAQGGILAPICSGDGAALSRPLGSRDIPGKEAPGCCVKGCHGGERRRTGKKCC